MKVRPVILGILSALLISLSSTSFAQASTRATKARRAPVSKPAAQKLTGTLKGVTESRLFIETAPGVEHTIRVDDRTVVLTADGEPQPIRHAGALLRTGEVVEVELDRQDFVKSALTVAGPSTYLVKK